MQLSTGGRRLRYLSAFSALVFATVGCSAGPPVGVGSTAATPTPTSGVMGAPNVGTDRAGTDWNAFVRRFVEETFQAQPDFAVWSGRHDFDGQMPDWSKEGLASEVERLLRAREEAQRFEPVALTASQRLERDHLLAIIDEELFWRARAQAPLRNTQWYLVRLDPEAYLSLEYAPLEARMVGYLGYARAVPRLAREIRANLRTPLPRVIVQRGIAGFGAFAQFYRNAVPRVFAGVPDPVLQKQLAEANEAAAAAMDDLKKWLEVESQNVSDDFALGEQLLSEMLKQVERIEVPLDRLVAAGRADLDSNLKMLRATCGLYLPTGTLRSCIDKMQANQPEDGLIALARGQLVGLREFLEQRQLVSIPTWGEVVISDAPPPVERNLPQVHFVVPPNRASAQAGKARLLYVAIHEVWPGHFLQYTHSQRNPSAVARLWTSYVYGEGWAHYVEEMMWDAGLGADDPEQHIAQLWVALIGNVRFLSALGLHAGRMTLEESQRLFQEYAFFDPDIASGQAARGAYDPAYFSYTLGKLMIKKLRDDWIAKRFNAATEPRQHWAAFHDAFLAYGGLPLPLVRREMLGDSTALL